MMKKVFIGVAVATVLACANPAKADAKVVTVKAAAKEMVKVSDKAYKDKKTHTVKFTLKGNDIWKVWDVYKEAGELETVGTTCDVIVCSIPQPANKLFKFGTQSDKNGTYKFVKGNNTITYSATFSGNNKGFRKRYYGHECARKIAKEIKSITKGKNQKMKAIIVMDWLAEHAKYHTAKNGDDYKTDAVSLYKGKAYSMCQGLAGLWSRLAKTAGIKKCGCVSYDGHMWNWLEVDGKKYYLEFQETPGLSITYDNWCDFDPDNVPEDLKDRYECYLSMAERNKFKPAWEVSKEDYCLMTKSRAMWFYGISGDGWKYL